MGKAVFLKLEHVGTVLYALYYVQEFTAHKSRKGGIQGKLCYITTHKQCFQYSGNWDIHTDIPK